MKIGIYASIDVGKVRDLDIEYIGVDQGVEHLLKQNIQPIVAIGDMDSIKDKSLLNNLKTISYSSIKDDTDTALALDYVIKQGYDEIDMYGVTKKRMDHFMAVLCLLVKYKNTTITIFDEYNKISLLKPGKHYIQKDGYKYFSLFAFKQTTISLSHCHYPLDNYILNAFDPLCVSNQMNNDYAVVVNDEDVLFIQSL